MEKITREDRNACLECENCIETEKNGSGKMKLTGENAGICRALSDYCFYCRYADGHAKLIAHKQDYTGNVPKWCGRLAR